MYFRKLLKNGQITLPMEIQIYMNIKKGEYLFLYNDKGSIVAVKHHENNYLNQCIFRNGRISIPVELRRLTGICVNTLLKIQINRNKNKIYITPEKESSLKEA